MFLNGNVDFLDKNLRIHQGCGSYEIGYYLTFWDKRIV